MPNKEPVELSAILEKVSGTIDQANVTIGDVAANSWSARHRIQPGRLWRRINGGEKLLIFDLLRYEEETEGPEGIPSSVRLDPSGVRDAHHVLFPSDLDVVLYCASPNHFRSSRVALELRNRGVRNIEVLAGALNAWRKEGLPMTHDLISSEEAISR